MINLRPPKVLKIIYKGKSISYYIVIYDKQKSQTTRTRKPKPIDQWDEQLAVLAAYENADPALQLMNEHLAEQYKHRTIKTYPTVRSLRDNIDRGDMKGFRKQYASTVASIQNKKERGREQETKATSNTKRRGNYEGD